MIKRMVLRLLITGAYILFAIWFWNVHVSRGTEGFNLVLKAFLIVVFGLCVLLGWYSLFWKDEDDENQE